MLSPFPLIGNRRDRCREKFSLPCLSGFLAAVQLRELLQISRSRSVNFFGIANLHYDIEIASRA